MNPMFDRPPREPGTGDEFSHLFTTVETLIPTITPRSSAPDHEPIGTTRPGNILRLVFDALYEPGDAEVIKEFLAPLRGQVVVDIGSGNSPWGYKIAEIAGATAYIGIDPVKHYVNDLRKQLITWRSNQPNLIPVALEQQGAETFLCRLPDASVSFLAGDIDWSILKTTQHRDSVSKQLARTLHPQGMFLSWNSAIDLPNDRFMMETLDDRQFDMFGAKLTRYRKK